MRMITSTRRISAPSGRLRQLANHDQLAGYILQAAGRLAKEVMVIRHIGIEIGPSGFDHDLAQHPDGGELVQRVVDGRQRDRNRVGLRLAVQVLGGYMAIDPLEQQAGESKTLPRRAQPRRAQTLS